MWNDTKDWFLSLGDDYGVDPFIFAVIYLLAIPFFTASIGWVVRRLLRGRPIVVPTLAAAFFYLSSYLYVFAFGRNIPLWVYGLMLGMISTGGYFTIQNIRKRTARMNPQDATHDVIVIGGGAAGLTAAGIAASLGARTLMVERHRLGGDCTWTGCVPSKALLKCAKVAHGIRHAADYGISAAEPEVDFAAVMAHVRRTREEVYHDADRPEIFEKMGVEVREGDAHFLDPHTIEIETEESGKRAVTTASARYVIIAAGGRPQAPPIEGLSEVDYHTSDTIFEIEEQPRRLAILGAGPIGTEMAQAFQRLGTEVTVIDRAERILSKDDAELAGMLHQQLVKEGVAYVFGAKVERVAQSTNGTIAVHVEKGGAPETVEADALLVAVGRAPNLEGLRLEAAGVERTKNGITVSERCRTNERHIYAIGDVTGRFQFTHMSEHMAKVACANALLKVPQKIDGQHLPWVTYADPELAHVGATEAELKENGTAYKVYRFPYEKLDRALAEGEPTGLIKVYASTWRGRILGASVLGERAGELICEYALAMKHGVTLRQIADTVHPYPTYGLGARRAADQWYAQKQTPRVVRLVKRVFGYRGPVNERAPGEVV